MEPATSSGRMTLVAVDRRGTLFQGFEFRLKERAWLRIESRSPDGVTVVRRSPIPERLASCRVCHSNFALALQLPDLGCLW